MRPKWRVDSDKTRRLPERIVFEKVSQDDAIIMVTVTMAPKFDQQMAAGDRLGIVNMIAQPIRIRLRFPGVVTAWILSDMVSSPQDLLCAMDDNLWPVSFHERI
jgi:hypothetical protein